MEGLRFIIGIILMVVAGVIGYIGYQYEDTTQTEVVSKITINTSSETKYYYTTSDNIQHSVTASEYINIPEKGTWTHVAPTHTGKIIMGVALVIFIIGAFIIAPDATFIVLILEGCAGCVS